MPNKMFKTVTTKNVCHAGKHSADSGYGLKWNHIYILYNIYPELVNNRFWIRFGTHSSPMSYFVAIKLLYQIYYEMLLQRFIGPYSLLVINSPWYGCYDNKLSDVMITQKHSKQYIAITKSFVEISKQESARNYDKVYNGMHSLCSHLTCQVFYGRIWGHNMRPI